MKWLKVLSEKPWLPEAAGIVPELGQTSYMPPIKITVNVLMIIISVFFLLFFITFITRSQYADFRALAGEPWQPFTDSWRLWINTAVLLLASMSMHKAVTSLRRGNRQYLHGYLAAGGFFAGLFIILQISVWQYLLNLGYGVAANPANSYFYILTGLHGLHLFGGLIALGRILNSLAKNHHPQKQWAIIEACTRYWHYLFVLWLVLFFILTRTPETYAFIAAACGLG
jgi:cytochrome c oxidase subunit 3